MNRIGDRMVTLRESPARAGFQPLSPVGQVLGEPRFRWVAHGDAWVYRIVLTDEEGKQVGRGWSGMHEMPLAWLRDDQGYPPMLAAGGRYRWQVFAYRDGPEGEPCAVADAEFLFLGP